MLTPFIIYRSYRLCGEPFHRHSGCPCHGKARGSLAADNGCGLTDQLLVCTLHNDGDGGCLLVHLEGDAFGLCNGKCRLGHTVDKRVTEVEQQVFALHGSSVTGTVDLKGLLEAVGNTNYHVVHKCAGETVKASVFLLIGGAGDVKHACLDLELHSGAELLSESSAGTLYRNKIVLADGYGDAGGDNDGHSSYS